MADYPLIPSAERIKLSHRSALSQFLETWNDYTLFDIGPNLTCTEAEVLADLFAAHDHHEKADALRAGHIEGDDEGDSDHNE